MKAERTKEGCKPERARQLGAPAGKAPFDKPTLKPYWGKLTVRNFRGDGGNVGIIRSPLRASVLPDRASGVEEPTPRMAVHHRAHGSDSERDTTCSYGVHEGRMQTYVLRGVCLVLA